MENPSLPALQHHLAVTRSTCPEICLGRAGREAGKGAVSTSQKALLFSHQTNKQTNKPTSCILSLGRL